MRYQVRSVKDADGPAVIRIFNRYIEQSYTAFPDKPIPVPFFATLLEISTGYPFYFVETDENIIIGFGFLHAYRPMEMFRRSAEVSNFIHPDHCRKGLGRQLLDQLVKDGKARGIDTLITMISSKNPESIRFHAKNGFQECGRLERVGRKFGTDFGIVMMQRLLPN